MVKKGHKLVKVFNSMTRFSVYIKLFHVVYFKRTLFFFILFIYRINYLQIFSLTLTFRSPIIPLHILNFLHFIFKKHRIHSIDPFLHSHFSLILPFLLSKFLYLLQFLQLFIQIPKFLILLFLRLHLFIQSREQIVSLLLTL